MCGLKVSLPGRTGPVILKPVYPGFSFAIHKDPERCCRWMLDKLRTWRD